MPRAKKIPVVHVDYEKLPKDLKKIYDEIFISFNSRNIYVLRETAHTMAVESPTTLTKEQLVKRMTDREFSKYLDPIDDTTQCDVEQRVSGYYDTTDGEPKLNCIPVQASVAASSGLRCADMAEGLVASIGSKKVIVNLKSTEGISRRDCFECGEIVPKRDFAVGIKGVPNLQKGDRVIYRDMTLKHLREMAKTFTSKVILLAGLAPEDDHIEGAFCIPFDASEDRSARTARLAAERAKRLCERGEEVVLIVYGFDMILSESAKRAVFGLGRCLKRGSITVIADINKDECYSKIATHIV